jgi:hypothetical protein
MWNPSDRTQSARGSSFLEYRFLLVAFLGRFRCDAANVTPP